VRKRALLVAALLPIAVGGAALALSGGSGEGAAPPGGLPGTGTGTVERRTLAERLTAAGTIGYAGESTVLARLSGTVTWLPKVGDTIERGERLYELGGKPVLLMYGEVPAYRELSEGVEEGADVRQLERNLAALGYEPGTVDGEFTSSTAAAVSAWQEDLGLEATGAVELGRVAFLPGPRRVTDVQVTLGQSIGAGGGGGGDQSDAPASDSPKKGEARPESDGDEEASEPGSVPVMKTSSTQRVVSVELSADQQSIAHRGQRVGVLLPGGEEARGKVRRIVATEDSSEEAAGGEAEPGVEVSVSLVGKTKVPALDGAAVSVLFTQSVRRDVLSVPLTALLAIGGERFAVIAVEAGQRRRIAVTPGLAADGYVEVEGKGLAAGMRVETGE